MLQAIGAAQLELDPGRRKQRPPALQTLQNSGNGRKTEGDAGGHRPFTIESPKGPERLTQVLTPPIPERQINGAAGRWAEPSQQRIELLRVLRVQRLQSGQNSQQFLLHRIQRKSAMPCLEPACLAAADPTVLLQFQLQAHDRCRGAATDGERHIFGQRKPLQGPGHGHQLQSPNCHNTAVTQTETA